MADRYRDVREALQNGDTDRARQLLDDIGANIVEGSYLKALAAPNLAAFMRIFKKLKLISPADDSVQQLIQDVNAAEADGQTLDEATLRRIVNKHIRTELTVTSNVTSAEDTPAASRQTPGTNVYQMLWDCQYCESEKLLGLTHRFCPNCGAAQNPDARYYPSDAEKVAVHDHEYTGVDVTCTACGELNAAKSDFCVQCGAPLSDAAKAKTLDAQTRAQGERFASSGSRDLAKEKYDAEMARVGITQEKKKRGGSNKKFLIGGAVVLVVLLIGAGIFLLNWTEETSLVATGHEWERSIDVERYNLLEVRSWRDSRPSGDDARIISGTCREEQRSTRRVADGEDCSTRRVDQGDGTFREEQVCTTRYREEPVYDDKCNWEVKRWEWERTARASGGLLDTPYWPETNVTPCSFTRPGCERDDDRNADYLIIFKGTDTDEVYRCGFEQGVWSAIEVQSAWTGQVRLVDSGALLCDTLQQN